MPTLMLIEAAWSLIRLRLAMGMGAGLLARLGAGRGRGLLARLATGLGRGPLARLGDRLRRCDDALGGPCPPLAACCR